MQSFTYARGEKQVTAREMQLGDVIEHSPHGVWSTCIVKQITASEVRLFRPYGTTADFEYTGGVICYVGIEEFGLYLSSDCKYDLRYRCQLR